MANPNNALGTNGAFGGRTSVNAFNDVLSAFSGRGVLSGWGCEPSTGLTVTIGGNGTDRDVAIAEDNVGNKTTVNNISQSPISVEMSAAPASNRRVDAIVAYIEASPSSEAITDNYDAVNLLVVNGSASSSPSLPSDSQIRTAITSDGASGSTAYYVVLASVTIPSGTTDIDATMISAGPGAVLASNKIDFANFGTTIAVAKGDNKNLPTVNITPPADGKLLVLCITNTTWGFGGGDLSVDITNNSGATIIASEGGMVSGGDTIGRQMTGYLFCEVDGGENYSFAASPSGGAGRNYNLSLIAMWFPG